MPVADQDQALPFYPEVLGCKLRTDIEVWPGARLVEVAPPGSSVDLVLLPADSEIPVAARLGNGCRGGARSPARRGSHSSQRPGGAH